MVSRRWRELLAELTPRADAPAPRPRVDLRDPPDPVGASRRFRLYLEASVHQGRYISEEERAEAAALPATETRFFAAVIDAACAGAGAVCDCDDFYTREFPWMESVDRSRFSAAVAFMMR